MRKNSLTFFFVLFCTLSFAQSPATGAANGFTAVSDTVNAAEATSADAEIYNGKIHTGYLPAAKGTAYYLTDDWQPGSVLYHQVLYTNVLLKYDLVRDEVIVKHYNGFSRVSLFSPRVQSFRLAGTNFVYLVGNGLIPGLYEELKKGPASLYVKRAKLIKEGIVAGQAETEFVEKNAYYLFFNGKFYPVKKQNDLLALLHDRRDAIASALKNSGLNSANEPEAKFKAIVESYNQSLR